MLQLVKIEFKLVYSWGNICHVNQSCLFFLQKFYNHTDDMQEV